jgi:hypothetical protein
MSDYRDNLHLAHWHAKACMASIAKALGDDLLDDEPPHDLDADDDLGGLVPPGGTGRARMRLVRRYR